MTHDEALKETQKLFGPYSIVGQNDPYSNNGWERWIGFDVGGWRSFWYGEDWAGALRNYLTSPLAPEGCSFVDALSRLQNS
jgi:hypothetical protein